MQNNNYIVIEKMTLDDLNNISDVLENEFDDFWNYNILKNEIESSSSICLVCKIHTEIIGFISATIVLDTAELDNIVIKKSHRKNGYSAILLTELINKINRLKCSKINLEVAENNIPAIHLYKNFNFEQVGLRKKYYNNSINALLFTKKLRS